MPFIVVCDLLFVPILCPIPFTVFEYRPVIIGEAKKNLKKGGSKRASRSILDIFGCSRGSDTNVRVLMFEIMT